MVKCTACGANIPSNLPFCNSCGQPIQSPAGAQRPATPVVQPKPVTPPEKILQPLPPSQETERVQPVETVVPVIQNNLPVTPITTAPAKPIEPRRTGLLWIAGVVVAVVLFGVWFHQLESKSINAAPPPGANSSVTNTPNEAPASAQPNSASSSTPTAATSATEKPVIMQFTNLYTGSDDGSQWYAHLKWMTVFANRLVLDTGKERYDLTPGMNARNIEVTAPHMVFHLTAYNANGSVTQDITVQRSTDTPLPQPNGNNNNALPEIDRFDVGKRIDTPIGSAVRIYYHATQNAELHLLYRDRDLPLRSTEPYVDFFVSRKVVFTLKAHTASGDVTKELTIAPDPNEDTDADSQEPGQPLHDNIDLVSSAAQWRVFSGLADEKDDPLSGWLWVLMRTASKDDFASYRNAICARHGYIFHEPKWRNFFNDRPWYRPETSDRQVVDSQFTGIERDNVNWLLKQQSLHN